MNKLIARQHLLPSLKWLIDQIISVDTFQYIDLLGKDYSTIDVAVGQLPPSVRLRQNVAQCFAENDDSGLILLDEGGGLHRELPEDLARYSAGVEQTTFGLQQSWKCPMVLVCRSAAKLLFESQIIARGIVRKLDSLELLTGRTVGVVGLGALGSALARTLMDMGIPTIGTDIRAVPKDLAGFVTDDIPELLHRADVILGCTGFDVLAGIDLGGTAGRKTFASCSSSDIEFRTVLRQLPVSNRFDTAQGWIGRMHCTVPNGGFPINFDRIREWELFEEIILTRKLMLEGLLQAKPLIGSPARGVMLDPAAQLQIVNEWLDQVPDRHTIRTPFALDEEFFRANSEGEIQMNEKPVYTLHSTTPGALAKMRSHQSPYDTDVMGLPIQVLPNVWSPAYDWSSLFYVENMLDVKGLDFLEIGCGTGVISIFAGRAGAKRVVAVDVNPEAVRNTRLNFERFGITNGETFLSDGFDNVSGKFDIVTWNAPYHGSKPTDLLERGCADEDYHDIRRFFREVSAYLKPSGVVVFGFSESGDLPLVESLIVESGFRIKRKLSDWRQDYNCMLFDLVRPETKREHF
jgi:release factor glutamine methyltransferase